MFNFTTSLNNISYYMNFWGHGDRLLRTLAASVVSRFGSKHSIQEAYTGKQLCFLQSPLFLCAYTQTNINIIKNKIILFLCMHMYSLEYCL